jgi:hypothetical protein
MPERMQRYCLPEHEGISFVSVLQHQAFQGERKMMASTSLSTIQRRDFLKFVGAIAAVSVTDSALAAPSRRVRILIDAEDPVASSEPVSWAVGKLRQSLTAKGTLSEIVRSTGQGESNTLLVLVARATSMLTKDFPQSSTSVDSPEGTRMVPGHLAGAPAIWISGVDQRGFVYGLLELAERVQFSEDSSIGLHVTETVEERPANEVRSVARAFCSEVEDKVWYYDKDFWRSYLDTLATSRFNRFNFAFGFGYDFPTGVTGDYFHFPYPYLVDVPGYKVRVVRLRDGMGNEVTPTPLDDAERERNLQTLRFIVAETAARGLQFQLGIWTHAYEWTNSPQAHHQIDGLTPETHATYCRDALAILLKTCPEIQGLTLRVHGESGVPEGSYPFWQTLFEAIAGCGRKVEIDMHAKGINQIMIDMAAHTGMPVKVGPKSWAEHMGLGYHQADIRALEIPRTDHMESGIFSVSNGERRFTRYGYADLFQEGRRFDVLFRLWPGTQRHLLWGDPEMAAAYGRTAHFCGAAGLEICEPLTFKGREGSGLPGGRCAYVDTSLNPKAGDWQKFEYTYRLWGRLLYNPEANPETWRRYLRTEFGAGAGPVEEAVANASRVLPLVTTTHLPSASNHSFWPDMYDNMPIVLGSDRSPYSDTPDPKCFGTVSPLDPQLFSSIVEHAKDLLSGHQSAKYSPIEVAQWLEDYTAASSQALTLARRQVASPTASAFRRMEEDVLIQNGLGRFFAAKLRSGVLFEIYQQTGDPEAGRLALSEYQKARVSWVTMAERAKGVYRTDITYGAIPMRRGHWSDRIAGIDRDVTAMESKLNDKTATSAADAQSTGIMVRAVTERVHRSSVGCAHTPPDSFVPGQPLSISLLLPGSNASSSVNLFYRHVNQAERWQSIQMERKQNGFRSAIPAAYTKSVFPVQYYFELHGADSAWLYPAFNATLSNQPYYAIAKRS